MICDFMAFAEGQKGKMDEKWDKKRGKIEIASDFT